MVRQMFSQRRRERNLDFVQELYACDTRFLQNSARLMGQCPPHVHMQTGSRVVYPAGADVVDMRTSIMTLMLRIGAARVTCLSTVLATTH